MPAIKLSSCHVTELWASLLLETPLTDSTSVSDDDGMRRNPFAVKWKCTLPMMLYAQLPSGNEEEKFIDKMKGESIMA